jgi:hypothetical protein
MTVTASGRAFVGELATLVKTAAQNNRLPSSSLAAATAATS